MKKLLLLSLVLLSFRSMAQTDVVEQNPVDLNGNKTYKYNAQILSTNFTIPILRVNFLATDPNAIENKKASASFFNSIGAGIGYSFCRLERTVDTQGMDIKQEMTNVFGIQLGVLFAANAGSNNTTSTNQNNTSPTNIFALTGAFTVLNFQIGAGYELGTVAAGQRRGFATVAYSIPLATLIRGGYWITHKKLVALNKVSNAYL